MSLPQWRNSTVAPYYAYVAPLPNWYKKWHVKPATCRHALLLHVTNLHICIDFYTTSLYMCIYYIVIFSFLFCHDLIVVLNVTVVL